MRGLKENERLICVGKTALRAPNGAPLPAVPQYIVVPVEDADPANVVGLQDGERVIVVGTALYNKKTAEERFDALKAGLEQPPKEAGVPLYIKVDARNINPQTGLSKGEEKACEPLIEDLLAFFAKEAAIKKLAVLLTALAQKKRRTKESAAPRLTERDAAE